MRLAVHHRTRYSFGDPVVHALQRLHLTPKSTSGQRVLDWKMSYEGAYEQLQFDDHNMNTTVLIAIEPGVKEVVIDCEGTIETADNHGIIGRHAGHLPCWHFSGHTDLTRPGARMRALADKFDPGADTLPMLHELSAAVLDAVAYQTGRTDSATRAEEALGTGEGVCQDHAHIFIGCARLLGVPARYVSGYLMMDGQEMQDAGHAWAEAHVDGLGWVGFDVSNQICPDERYIRVATGQDYAEAAPVKGISLGGSDAGLDVELSIRRREQRQSQDGQKQIQNIGGNGMTQSQTQQRQTQQRQSQQEDLGPDTPPGPQD
ncbi:transglutaminase family protein [Croceicoccus marinus]|uniref:Transglutaminase family protein n=1 Tax=Croceicoccus marinus TaxID=450378 RepID=A0A7G6VQL2_9SPHN|nr:transglutaminase family protein [Croceicoccus marinus]QNE04027.1 transglutaminase family protein [Croceicoccus marinus]